MGKSLKKKGFDRDGFLNNLETVGVEINGTIHRRLETNTLVSLTPSEGLLDGIRQWRCNLDGAEVVIPCGGTHVERLSEIGDVKITLAPSEDGFVIQHTLDKRKSSPNFVGQEPISSPSTPIFEASCDREHVAIYSVQSLLGIIVSHGRPTDQRSCGPAYN
ncbi:alanine-tRNA synthetase second additional domain-containing protein [Mesorhizobium caraganae]|uniref:alanine-tRNA synthetase second additional domain-containing protein n=1 Tax=Mesorhizobium caraganae TaxID=483206 RepID=UPI001786B03A|nr:alanine-tRNA synthetase second additional domain-containing protein [Mesorhizobium caraganae]